jgi:hypothetical protein
MSNVNRARLLQNQQLQGRRRLLQNKLLEGRMFNESFPTCTSRSWPPQKTTVINTTRCYRWPIKGTNESLPKYLRHLSNHHSTI